MHKHITTQNVTFGNDLPFVLIAGPCQMESRDHAMMVSETLYKLTKKLGIGFVYKTSFDKANRTSVSSERGLGMEKAMPVFEEIKKTFECPVLTDVHSEAQATEAGEVVDILQIPAFLCRQTDLLLAAAKTGKVVNVKKGQFLAPWDMKNVAAKIEAGGNENILLTERGASFGYNTLVNDMRALPIMAQTGYPVIFDTTHSVQQPGGLGGSSGGQRVLYRRWRVQRLPLASPASSLRRMRTQTTRHPTGHAWCAWVKWKACSAHSKSSTILLKTSRACRFTKRFNKE